MFRNKNIKYSVIFIVLVLIISYSFALYIFSSPETIELFTAVMFVPAIVALVINSIRYRSIKLVFKPITTKINLKSILFSILYPLLFIGLISILIYLLGIAEFNEDKLQYLKKLPSIALIIIFSLMPQPPSAVLSWSYSICCVQILNQILIAPCRLRYLRIHVKIERLY